MTKSTITREQLEEWVAQFDEDGGCDATDRQLEALIRQSLAAMDSESGCLPLDYLQGHKDGLEWASQLAEANHPETGDWLYDDPIELAKAIRKGPDMPPAQPVADTKPVAIIDQANLDYLRSGADADVWPPEREEMGDVLLYRHAQPAPVVPEEMTPEMMRAVQLNSELGAYAASNLSGAYDLFAEFWKVACRAAMLNQAQEPATYNTAPQPAVVSDEMIDTFEAEFRSAFKVSPEVKQMLEIGYHGEKFSFSIRDAATWWKLGRAAMLQGGNSPVIPDGWTCNDKANAALMMLDRIETADPVDDDRIDGIKRIVRELAAAPHDTPALNSVQSVVTLPGKWIPVSERMPEDRAQVILWDAEIGEVTSGHYSHKTQTFYHCGDAIENEITHWMPPPCAPQEAINALISVVSRNEPEGK